MGVGLRATDLPTRNGVLSSQEGVSELGQYRKTELTMRRPIVLSASLTEEVPNVATVAARAALFAVFKE